MTQKGIIDFTDCTTYKDMFERVRIAMDLPEGYGGNLHAVWDCFFGITAVNDFVIKGKSKAAPILHPYIDEIIAVFQKFKVYCEKRESTWQFNYTVID